MRLGEARAHALILAAVLWSLAAVLLAGSSRIDRLGQLKGRDFVFFYTLGAIVVRGDSWRLYDMDAEHELRAELVPESAESGFASAYPPHTPLIFAPLARLSYGVAAGAWMTATSIAYVWCVWTVLAGVPRDWRRVLWPFALGFPPAWFLILGGQTTAIPLLGFTLGWLALRGNKMWLAGFAFGLIAVKPQLGLLLALVLVATGAWSVIAGAVLSALLQMAAAAVALGTDVIPRYWEVLHQAGTLRGLLQPHAAQVQSLQALTDLLPAPLNDLVWILGALTAAFLVVRVWVKGAPLRLRMAVLVMATVLVSPHLLIYDVAILILPVGWLAVHGVAQETKRFGFFLYALSASLVVPFAMLTGVQISVMVLIGFFAWTLSLASHAQGAVLIPGR